MRGFKGASATPRLQHWARGVSETFADAHTRTIEIGAHSHDTSIPQSMDLQRLRAVMMEQSRPSRRLKCPRPLLLPHLPRQPRLHR
jgi:hypothetical protein